MMLLSRFWYVLLGLALGVALYVVFLAVGQYNRKDQRLMTEGLASDSQTVEYVLKIDSRRRLDRLLVGSADKGLGDALVGAAGKRPVPGPSKDAATKALAGVMDQIEAQFKPDYLFGVDREGRVIGEVGFDTVKNNEDFELGGYPAVFDALHGFLRDDTWVWNGKLFLVSARPVETVAGEAPAGAIVGLKEMSKAYALGIAKLTRTNLAFYAAGKPVSVATPPRDPTAPPSPNDIADNQLQEVEGELDGLSDDPGYECATGAAGTVSAGTVCAGRSTVHNMKGDALGAMYARLNGDAWDQHAGFAVVRTVNPISSPFGFITQADDLDKKSAPLIRIALVALLALLAGIGFTFLEHTLPLGELAKQAAALREGRQDGLQVARFRGAYRLAAQNLNNGMERIIEKGGGAPRKAADLESILGPVPAQPAMSAFSFPLKDGNAAFPQGPPPPPSHPHAPPAPPPQQLPPTPMMAMAAPPGPPPIPQAPGSVPGRPPPSGPQVMKATPAVPFNPGTSPNAFTPAGAGGGTLAMPQRMGPPPPLNAPPGPPPAPRASPATASPAHGAVAARPAPAPPPPPPPPPPPAPAAKIGGEDADDEEATMVAAIPAEVLAQATGENRKADIEATEWLSVYEDFIRTKKQCGEATDGLTFEKFQHTLKKNRDALMQRHGCKRVKFSVYVKEGRASLKATPVKD